MVSSEDRKADCLESGEVTRRANVSCSVMALAAFLAILVASAALGANADEPRFELKPGQELTIPIAIADGHVVVGIPRVSKIGVAQPKDGEITVGLEREMGELYDKITA